MPSTDAQILRGSIVEEYTVLTIGELGRLCTVETHRIMELVDEGILEAETGADGEWRFAAHSLRRARIALRLHRDLGVNMPGVGLALDLLDEIALLRHALHLRDPDERRP